MNVSDVFQRQKFEAWGPRQDSIQMVVAAASTFVGTFLAAPSMKRLGLQATARLHGWCGAAMVLILACAPRVEALLAAPVFMALQHGDAALGRCLELEAELLGLGQGALAAAQANRCFLPSVVMPQLFTGLYSRCAERCPRVPLLVAAA